MSTLSQNRSSRVNFCLDMSKKSTRPTTDPPPIAFALIAKDAEAHLPACLASIRPYAQQIVVCVDERTTDKTARVAKRYGAEVHSIKVSDWHECGLHGRVLAQDFARARNESFTYLNPDIKWWVWIDSDDILKGGENLAAVLEAVPDEMVGLWLQYHYSTMGGGKSTNTLFHRERILRASVGWKWQYRVHEVVSPLKPGPWILANDIQIYHQEGAHKTESSAQRNLLLLEIDYEADQGASRTLFYLGNQYFAMGQWQEAASWYERLGQLAGRGGDVNPYELWQSRCYQALALQKLNNINMAQQAAFAAIDARPQHPEPYYILASLYSNMGQPEKAVYWTEHGRKQQEPPFFVFKNPLDYTFNNRLPMSDALAQMGLVAEARAELETAYGALDDPNVAAGVEHYRKIEQEAEEGKRFKEWAAYTSLALNGNGDDLIASRYSLLPREVRGIQSVRDVAVPILHSRKGRPRMVFMAVSGWEEWAPPKINETGLGGSETAVIQIARRFAEHGWRVDVYNNAGSYEGVYDGVGYWDARRYDPTEADIFVNWRAPWFQPPSDVPSILWCHDLNYGPRPPEEFNRYDRVLGVSQWHADKLHDYYNLREEQVGFVPNGVDLSRFDPAIRKVPFRCVYASSADRGLLQLLHLWPQIIGGESAAELHVAYGWDTVDRMIERGRTDLQQLKDAVNEKIEQTPQVVWRGRLSQNTLARLYSESWLWLYPTNFLEVSCISAMEAMAGGCVPVTSSVGALPETIGTAGVVVQGLPHSFPWQNFYVQCAKATLKDASIRKPLEYAGRGRAQELTWDSAFTHWQSHVMSLLKSEVAV